MEGPAWSLAGPRLGRSDVIIIVVVGGIRMGSDGACVGGSGQWGALSLSHMPHGMQLSGSESVPLCPRMLRGTD